MVSTRSSPRIASLCVSVAVAALAAACGEQATEPKAGPAATMAITEQPHGATAGTRFDPPFSIVLRDSAGLIATDSRPTITVSIASGSGTASASLRGTTTAVPVDGVARFSSVSIDSAGTGFRLSASAAGLATVTSAAFDVAPGPSSRLAFAAVPAEAGVEEPLGAPLRLLILDSLGNLATTAGDPVTLFAVGSGTLTGATTQNAVSGVATFADVAFDRPGRVALGATAPGLTGAVTSPIQVTIVARTVTAGDNHTCVLTPRDAAYCWGDDYYGEIGDGIDVSSPSRFAVSRRVTRVPDLRFKSLQAGLAGTCGVTPAGQAYCWGLDQPYSSAGRTITSSPVAVGGASGLASVSYGSHACGLSASGAAACWGNNAQGQLGSGSTDLGGPTPVTVSGGLTFVSIRAANSSSCGVTSGRDAFCWGYNPWGNLGLGYFSFYGPRVPTKVVGGLAWQTVDASGKTTCGVTTGGDAYCWGANDFGQLGTGVTDTSSVAAPLRVTGSLTFAAITIGGHHVCGLTTGGTAYCWGANTYGTLGNGTTVASTVPVAAAGNLTFTAISAGGAHTCGVATGGAVYCWGHNSNGQLGFTGVNATTPVRVPGF